MTATTRRVPPQRGQWRTSAPKVLRSSAAQGMGRRFLADFLSRSALIGFLTGVGVQVAIGQLAGLFGLPNQGHGSFGQLASVVERVDSAHGTTLGLAVAVIGIILGSKRIAPRLPGALIAVVGGIGASAVFDLARHGISALPAGEGPTAGRHDISALSVAIRRPQPVRNVLLHPGHSWRAERTAGAQVQGADGRGARAYN